MAEDHNADRARLLAKLPPDGSAIGNIALMRSLHWSEHRYWYVRDSLLEAGKIARAKGRGGAVRLVHPGKDTSSQTAVEAELVGEATLASVHETELYLPIQETLNFLAPWIGKRAAFSIEGLGCFLTWVCSGWRPVPRWVARGADEAAWS